MAGGGNDDGGVRAQDEYRMQALTGPEADYDPNADRQMLMDYHR